MLSPLSLLDISTRTRLTNIILNIMESFDPEDNPDIWSYDGIHLCVEINGERYPRCTTKAIHKAFRKEEHWPLDTYRAQLLHYGLQDTADYETAKERLRAEVCKHVKPKNVSTDTEMTVPPELQTLESHLTAL